MKRKFKSMLRRLLQILHLESAARRCLRRLRRQSQQFSATSPDFEYQQRVAREKAAFNECLNVHDLPEIFHYWSNKHLAPKNFHQFGITDPEQFFFLYAKKFHQRFPGKPLVMLSIGSGNCDMEARLAKKLLAEGIAGFTLECLDFNEAMLARGRQHAAELGVGVHIIPVCADFNSWQPQHAYDVVMANQCLHHVLELESLFALIKGCLDPEGYFLVSDMIGRNGHQRWPEALKLVQDFWQELPKSYRYNQLMSRQEPEYINHDCATESFEGIRAQDILPLLISNFHFELFIPFASLVTVFIDRPFGHNFDAKGVWDRDFIDRVHARDEAGLLSGELTPTQMMAVLRSVPVATQLLDVRLTPEACVRNPLVAPQKSLQAPSVMMAGATVIRPPGGIPEVHIPPASALGPGQLSWQCNICGAANCSPAVGMERESGACQTCGSVMRYRSLMAVLSQRLLGKIEIVADTAANPKITGLGMSDDTGYARLLAEKCSYTNTFYHCEPLLDITRPQEKWLGANDFVITSDVFEHVPPPIQIAFDNLYALLKPGGVLVFSVPFNLEASTREHYPNLHDFKLREEESGVWVLENVTKEGVKEEFRDLVFHGGPGSTLELRVFCRDALEQHLVKAGFTDLRLHSESHFGHGIFWLSPFSLVVSAQRPR